MTEAFHPSDVTLMDYAHNPQSVADRSTIDEHLAVCSSCANRLEEYKVFDAALRDADTWWAVDETSTNSIRRMAQAFQKRLKREDTHAQLLLGKALESQYRFTYANILRRRSAHTGGVVRLLTARARELADRDPRFAIELADTACVIASSLPDDYYPANVVYDLRGTAWKEYAVACRYRGLLKEGMDATDRAARAYGRTIESTLALATVNVVRALIAWEQGNYDDALRYCRTSLVVFKERNEDGQYVQAKEIEAMILHRQGHVASARESYLEVYVHAERSSDDETRARAARNLAVAETDLGQIPSAKRYLNEALQIFERRRNNAMIAHTRWAICWTALLSGNATEAAQNLPEVIAQLSTVGLAADAARAQLDFAEALFVLGKFDQVAAACSGLGAFFRGANMLSGALTAAAFLTEAAASKAALERGERSRRLEGRALPSPP